jgi:muconate cycloisomerase
MIQSIEVIRLLLPIARMLKLSRGVASDPKAGAPHILVKVTDENGIVGWGEARPSPRWSYETPETVVTTIRIYLVPALLGKDEFDLDGIHKIMDTVIAPGVQIGQPIAKSAIDIALHDLAGKKRKTSLSAMLGGDGTTGVKLGYVVSATTIDEAVAQTAEGLEQGYHGFKVKTGIRPEIDLEMVQEISKVAGGKYLWIDANQGWQFDEAIRFSTAMANFGVHVLEQPLAANDITGYRDLVQRSGIPIALDESIYSPRDLVQFVKLKAINGLVIKICRVGGIYWAKKMAAMARDEGLLLLGSGLTEGRISLTSSVHVFSSFKMDVPVDLNGPQFLRDDMVAGPFEFPGREVHPPMGPGLGIEPDPEKIERYRVED